jgi:tetratricopeptide (TPR) repeat protein
LHQEVVVTPLSRCIAAGFILLIISWISIAGQESIDELQKAGLREYHAGNFTAAKALFDQALKSAVSAGNKDLEALFLNDLGNVEIGIDRPERAYEDYRRAFAILRRMPDKQFRIAATLRNLGAAETLQGNYDEAEKFLTEARKTLLSHPGLPDSQLLTAEILNSQGIVLVEQGKLGKALPLFKNAMRTRAAAGVPEEWGDAQTLNNLGVIYRKQHKYMEAERAFLKSIDITDRKGGPSHPDVTLTLANLAELYTAIGRYDDANGQLERCLVILRGLEQPLYGRIVRTLGLAGSNYIKQGDERNAVRSFQEVIVLSRSVALNEPALPEIFDVYAELLLKQGKTSDARDLHADARRLRLKNALTVRARNTE